MSAKCKLPEDMNYVYSYFFIIHQFDILFTYYWVMIVYNKIANDIFPFDYENQSPNKVWIFKKGTKNNENPPVISPCIDSIMFLKVFILFVNVILLKLT